LCIRVGYFSNHIKIKKAKKSVNFEGVTMMSDKQRKPESDAVMASFQFGKNRRKAYYHGKYNREVFSVVFVCACVAAYVMRQGF